MSYQPKVYRKQGGDQLVVASGGSIVYEAGGYPTVPIQSLAVADVATTVTNYGLTVLTGSTTGPTFTMAAPVVGLFKGVSLSHSSSGVTHRCVLRSNSTGVSFDTTGGNQITFATSATRGVSLIAETTAKWRIVGVYTGASISAPRTT